MKKSPWWNRRSLSKQLLLGFGLSLTTVGLATLGINYGLMRTKLNQQVQAQATAITQSLVFSTEGILDLEHRELLQQVVQNFATLPAIAEIAIVHPNGSCLACSNPAAKNRPYASLRPELTPLIAQATQTGTDQHQKLTLDNQPVLAQIHPFNSAIFGASGQRGTAIALLDLHKIQHETGKTFLTSTLILLTGTMLILVALASLIRRNVLRPIRALNDAVTFSTRTGLFALPHDLPDNELRFLAISFERVLKQLESYDQLKREMNQRKQVEAILRESEVRERKKSYELQATLRELRQAQAQLVQSEKMSSLGQLVAGVAHEINNPVNFIHGNLHHASQYADDLLRLIDLYRTELLNPSESIQAMIEDVDLDFIQEDLPNLFASMQVGANRIREIVQSLRTFSRLDEAEVKDVDIHDGIDSTLMILRNRLKERPNHPEIQVIKDYGNLPKIECYAGQLNQVFMNILSNAIDALDNTMTQRSLTDDAPPAQIIIRTELIDTSHIAIAITDNGPGMSAEVTKRLFDPFFTTKPVGQGTGMGLSISHQIVSDRHHGKLICQSTPGQGATFVIELPIHQQGFS